MKKPAILQSLFLLLGIGIVSVPSWACTGLSLTAQDGSFVQGRTIEWAKSPLPSRYVVIPRGHRFTALTPDGSPGLAFTARYGTVGLAVMQDEFIAEGINEAGLSVGLFFFPRYGSYSQYDTFRRDRTIGDLQLTSWMLTQFRTIDEIKAAICQLHIVGLFEESVIHWRLADASGRQEVLEIVGGKLQFFRNEVGVLANAPGFAWHLTNLNNYVNLFPGDAPIGLLGDQTLRPLSGSSGMIGLPGDATSPSRFVRAAFLRATAPSQPTALETVLLCFHLLNNFDVPVGIEHPFHASPAMLSATQWSVVTDLTHRRIYYKTATNNRLRCIDLSTIDFAKVRYQSQPLDPSPEQPIEYLTID